MHRSTVALWPFALLFGACNGPSAAPPGPPLPARAAPAPSQPAGEAAAPGATTPAAPPEPAAARAPTWTFDADAVDAAPAGFRFGRTGPGEQGRWVVRAEPDAPSPPHVLAQLDADATSGRFPMAVTDAPVQRDLRISVRCKMVSGRVDQACGLVARYRDENNYYIARANALEHNIRLYTVKDGRRRQLASWSGAVTPNEWHELLLEVRGDLMQVRWNGKPVLDHRDETFGDAGRAGLWTKADSVTYFDDLRVEAL